MIEGNPVTDESNNTGVFVDRRKRTDCTCRHEQDVHQIKVAVPMMQKGLAELSAKMDTMIGQLNRIAILEEKHSNSAADINRAHKYIVDLENKHAKELVDLEKKHDDDMREIDRRRTDEAREWERKRSEDMRGIQLLHDQLSKETLAFINQTKGFNRAVWLLFSLTGGTLLTLLIKVLFFMGANGVN